MFQVRFHGRGGQGVVTAAELLAVAAFLEGKHAQAFPIFGSERTGAPIVAFCRIAAAPIRTHEPIDRPDALVIQDATLLHSEDLLAGLAEHGDVLLNSERSLADLGMDELVAAHRAGRIVAIPATQLALDHTGRPLPNAALLGGFAALTGVVSVDAVGAAIAQHFPDAVARANQAAAQAAAAAVAARVAEVSRAPAG